MPAAAQTVLGEATLALPLEGVIDFGAERERISKEIAKLDGEIVRLDTVVMKVVQSRSDQSAPKGPDHTP